MAGMLIAIAALVWQSFIVQTHIHYPAAPLHAARTVDRSAHPAGSPADCPICREIVQVAAYLTPTPPLLSAPPAGYVLLAALPIGTPEFLHFAPPWRSRAPPRPHPA